MTTPRWYMVNKMGMATLCTDKADAEKEAADAQRFWPHMGPHRAVQLVEVDSIAASAGSDPVAWQSIETAPKDGTRILLHPAVEVHDAWSKGYWSEQHKCWIAGGSASGVTHTHWMKLPEPPYGKN